MATRSHVAAYKVALIQNYQLYEMGFSKPAADAALQAAGGSLEGAVAQLAAAERARDAETRAAADDIAAMKRELEQQKPDLAAKAEMLRLKEEAHELRRQRAEVEARELQLAQHKAAPTKHPPTAVLAVFNASPDADGYYREDGLQLLREDGLQNPRSSRSTPTGPTSSAGQEAISE